MKEKKMNPSQLKNRARREKHLEKHKVDKKKQRKIIKKKKKAGEIEKQAPDT